MERATREDWIRAGRLALLKGGADSVRVERLARDLRLTKGSFYWHFANRGELLEALLREWEDEADLLIGALAAQSSGGLRSLVDQLAHNVVASERGDAPSDAAIFRWAATSPEVAQRVNVAEEERVALIAALIGDRDAAEIAYMAYLGFILRRRHSSDPNRTFKLVGELFLSMAARQRSDQSGYASTHSNSSAEEEHP